MSSGPVTPSAGVGHSRKKGAMSSLGFSRNLARVSVVNSGKPRSYSQKKNEETAHGRPGEKKGPNSDAWEEKGGGLSGVEKEENQKASGRCDHQDVTFPDCSSCTWSRQDLFFRIATDCFHFTSASAIHVLIVNKMQKGRLVGHIAALQRFRWVLVVNFSPSTTELQQTGKVRTRKEPRTARERIPTCPDANGTHAWKWCPSGSCTPPEIQTIRFQ